MTAAHPRDPRLRRRADLRSPLEAAVALEVAADRMRAGLRSPEPEPVYPDPERIDPAVRSAIERWDTAAHLTHTIAEDSPEDDRPTLAELYRNDPSPSAQYLADVLEAEAATEQGDDPEPDDEEPAEDPAPEDGPYWDPARYVAGGQTHPEPAPSVAPAVRAPDQHVSPAEVFSSEHPRAAWRSRHDPRSLAFGVARVLRGSGPLQRVELPTGPVLDQTLAGATVEEQSCCTGCGLVAALNILRPDAGFALDDAAAIYARAKQIDAVPGEDYAGTSVLAALQAARDAEMFGGYLWCFGTRHIAQTLIQRRLPVVVGVRWYEGMWETGPGGLVEISGEDVGLGHVLTIVGLELKGPQGQAGPYFRWQNSVGTSYGDGGFGYVHHRDLSQLLAGAGEAAVPTLDPQAPQ